MFESFAYCLASVQRPVPTVYSLLAVFLAPIPRLCALVHINPYCIQLVHRLSGMSPLSGPLVSISSP